MVSSLSCCTVNEFYTSCYRLNSSSRDRVVPNSRNLGISQMGFSHNVRNNLLSSRKILSLIAMKKSVSSVDQDSEEHSFTVSYLINSCGLSPEVAISSSEKVRFKNMDNPDSVLAVLREYGFENTHIAKLVSKEPSVLLAKPGSNIIPKLEYFRSIGLQGSRLAEFCSSGHYIFNFSLKNRIIPSCDFLKSFLADNTKVAAGLNHRLFQFSKQKNISSNIEFLKESGATSSVISYMLLNRRGILTMESSKFEAGVNEVLKLGFKPSKFSFVQAIYATILMSKSKWEKKVKVYQRWGCSDNDISSAFLKNPVCMLASDKKIEEVMKYLVNELGLEPADVIRSSNFFAYNLKNRIIPRCTVLRVLQLKGLLKREMSFTSYVSFSEARFVERIMKKYEEQVPELWSVYSGEMSLSELAWAQKKY